MTTTIRTNSGPVMGISKETDLGKKYFSFQHIPYAQTPTGELRFRDPKPVTPWKDLLDCTKEGSPARNLDLLQPDGPKIVGSDDCLGVNVFTPDLRPSKPLPVFVWIHGGGFVCGSSSVLMYGPDYFVEKDVICVSLNYRLGIFGFLSLKDPKVGVPGNAGLKDQSMALKWIKNNIACFGGDPNNITLAGESAGSASVHYQLISPLSKDLFNRAICFSGAALNPWASVGQNYEKHLKKLVVLLGLTGNEDDKTIFEAISKTDPEKLIQLETTLLEKNDVVFGPELLSTFVPQVEPYNSAMNFLPKPIVELGRTAWSKNIDVIFGGTANEGLMKHMFAPMDAQFDAFKKDPSVLLPEEIRKKATSKDLQAKGHKLKELYFKSSDTLTDFIDYSTDCLFWHGIHRAINQRKAGQGLNYVYYLNVEPSVSKPQFYQFGRSFSKIPHMKGMAHAEDLALYFKSLFVPRFEKGDDIYEVQQAFLTFITDFTKNGKMKEWDPLKKEGKVMEITTKKWEMAHLKNSEKLRVWDELYDPKDLL